MWHIDVQKIFGFRGGAGDRFVELCNSLIYSETKINLIPLSAIRTMAKTTVGDGGIDTMVNQGSSLDKTGWFLDKSIWQFKASAGNVSDKALIEEINKDFSKKIYPTRICL